MQQTRPDTTDGPFAVLHTSSRSHSTAIRVTAVFHREGVRLEKGMTLMQ